ncbi:hypothetical protein [Cytophaga aurantiaca]|uniref:hypothetical protein n=1 Tax=Cytophaga aurantiaca TaxID=29530 RepID=UPI0012FADDDF|nr:hypothetical protein [Cytophaga aurantiaca]
MSNNSGLIKLNNLKGAIKQMSHKDYCLNEDESALVYMDDSGTYTFFFNEECEIIKEAGRTSVITYYNFSEGKILRWEWYDEGNNLIQYETYEYDNISGFAINYYIKRSDGSEKRIQPMIEKINENTFMHHYEYYDDLYVNDKLVERRNHDNIMRIKYEYVGSSHTEKRYIRGVIQSSYTFNEFDFLIKQMFYDEKGVNIGNEILKYDVDNKLIETITNKKEYKFPIHEVYVYDVNNLLIEKQFGSSEYGLETANKYEYDSQKNLIYKSGDWENARFQYTYDDCGNWIEMMTIKDSRVVFKTTREIEYFK